MKTKQRANDTLRTEMIDDATRVCRYEKRVPLCSLRCSPSLFCGGKPRASHSQIRHSNSQKTCSAKCDRKKNGGVHLVVAKLTFHILYKDWVYTKVICLIVRSLVLVPSEHNQQRSNIYLPTPRKRRYGAVSLFCAHKKRGWCSQSGQKKKMVDNGAMTRHLVPPRPVCGTTQMRTYASRTN